MLPTTCCVDFTPEANTLCYHCSPFAVNALCPCSSAANRSWWPHHHPLAHLAAAAAATSTRSSSVEEAEVPTPPLSSRPTRPPWWAAGAAYGHKLQRLFGIDHFALLQPESYSGRVLDVNEAAALVSAAALAVAGTGVTWPVLLPVHDALRDAYTGVALVRGCSVGVGLRLGGSDCVWLGHVALNWVR